jgi:hypothetical protein
MMPDLRIFQPSQTLYVLLNLPPEWTPGSWFHTMQGSVYAYVMQGDVIT